MKEIELNSMFPTKQEVISELNDRIPNDCYQSSDMEIAHYRVGFINCYHFILSILNNNKKSADVKTQEGQNDKYPRPLRE